MFISQNGLSFVLLLIVYCFMQGSSATEKAPIQQNITSAAFPENVPEFKLTAKNFFLTPPTDYMAARDFCHHNEGVPFVPTTKLELRFLEYKVTKANQNGWLPLTDIRTEGLLQWEDGTDYVDGFLEIEMGKWSLPNREDKNCVAIDSVGEGFWVYCFFEKPMLCIRRSFKKP